MQNWTNSRSRIFEGLLGLCAAWQVNCQLGYPKALPRKSKRIRQGSPKSTGKTTVRIEPGPQLQRPSHFAEQTHIKLIALCLSNHSSYCILCGELMPVYELLVFGISLPGRRLFLHTILPEWGARIRKGYVIPGCAGTIQTHTKQKPPKTRRRGQPPKQCPWVHFWVPWAPSGAFTWGCVASWGP